MSETKKDAATKAETSAEAPKKKVRRGKRTLTKARACVFAGENNTIITITDLDGKTLAWASSGACGFKGSRKSTPYAAKVAAEKVMSNVESFGIQNLDIEIRGIGQGREQAIRGLQVPGLTFDSIIDRTPVAHGGCKPKKPRRV